MMTILLLRIAICISLLLNSSIENFEDLKKKLMKIRDYKNKISMLLKDEFPSLTVEKIVYKLINNIVRKIDAENYLLDGNKINYHIHKECLELILKEVLEKNEPKTLDEIIEIFKDFEKNSKIEFNISNSLWKLSEFLFKTNVSKKGSEIYSFNTHPNFKKKLEEIGINEKDERNYTIFEIFDKMKYNVEENFNEIPEEDKEKDLLGVADEIVDESSFKEDKPIEKFQDKGDLSGEIQRKSESGEVNESNDVIGEEGGRKGEIFDVSYLGDDEIDLQDRENTDQLFENVSENLIRQEDERRDEMLNASSLENDDINLKSATEYTSKLLQNVSKKIISEEKIEKLGGDLADTAIEDEHLNNPNQSQTQGISGENRKNQNPIGPLENEVQGENKGENKDGGKNKRIIFFSVLGGTIIFILICLYIYYIKSPGEE